MVFYKRRNQNTQFGTTKKEERTGRKGIARKMEIIPLVIALKTGLLHKIPGNGVRYGRGDENDRAKEKDEKAGDRGTLCTRI